MTADKPNGSNSEIETADEGGSTAAMASQNPHIPVARKRAVETCKLQIGQERRRYLNGVLGEFIQECEC